MKMSTKGRYSLRMMIDIAEQGANAKVSIKEISERQGISIKYLEQIVPNLTRAGLLRSERGAGGGYMLTLTPAQYTVGAILRAVEGNLAPVACLYDEKNYCERNSHCKTVNFWTGLYEVINDYVDSVTLQNFLE